MFVLRDIINQYIDSDRYGLSPNNPMKTPNMYGISEELKKRRFPDSKYIFHRLGSTKINDQMTDIYELLSFNGKYIYHLFVVNDDSLQHSAFPTMFQEISYEELTFGRKRKDGYFTLDELTRSSIGSNGRVKDFPMALIEKYLE